MGRESLTSLAWNAAVKHICNKTHRVPGNVYKWNTTVRNIYIDFKNKYEPPDTL